MNNNLNEMIWERIIKIDDEELKKSEEIQEVKLPEDVKKYIKAYNRGVSFNLRLNIDEDDFEVSIEDFRVEK